MKRILYNILLVMIMLLPISVFAEGYVSVSPGSLTIEQGSSKTFTISAYNTIGDVSISSSNSGVASISTNQWGTGMVEEKQTKTGTVTVTGVSVGTTTITIVIDAATFDEEDLSGQTKTITVNVVSKPEPTPTPTPTPTPSNPNNNNSGNNNHNTNSNLSSNNNIKSLSVEGYNLVKVDNNNYELSVSNNITSIKINAEAEDSKAKISGTGLHELNIGENNIQVLVTSESGSQNKINIKVTRKDGYYLEDLNSLLDDSKIDDIQIIINADSKISSEDLNNIKKSKKKVNLNYYDKNKKLIYSWTLDGSKIKDSNEFLTSILYTSEYIKDIEKLSNYADGLYINFNSVPKGTKIKLYVGDKFDDQSIVNVYHYDKDKKILGLLKDSLTVKEGYIEFYVEDSSEYFVTMSNISVLNKTASFTINLFIIISLVELIIIVTLILIYFLKIRSIKK